MAVPRVSMPAGRKFQALWAALHAGALGLSVYVALTDIKRASRAAPRTAGMSILGLAAALHLASAVYHWQRAV